MSIVKELVEFIEKLEKEATDRFSKVQKSSYLTACREIKAEVISHLSHRQRELLKELNLPLVSGKSLDKVWNQELTDTLELLDMGLLESTEEANVVRISDKGKKLIEQ